MLYQYRALHIAVVCRCAIKKIVAWSGNERSSGSAALELIDTLRHAIRRTSRCGHAEIGVRAAPGCRCRPRSIHLRLVPAGQRRTDRRTDGRLDPQVSRQAAFAPRRGIARWSRRLAGSVPRGEFKALETNCGVLNPFRTVELATVMIAFIVDYRW